MGSIGPLTTLLEASDDLFVVSRLLGHSTVATTSRFYAHVPLSMLQASADQLDAVMRPATGA